MGGVSAISQGVENAIRALGYNIVRYGGIDRFFTAVKNALQGLGSPGTSLEATGVNFPDALTAGAAGCKAGGAVILTAGSTMPSVSRNYLNAHPGARFAIGGPSAAADPAATPVVGVDRYDTGRKTALRFFSGPTVVGLASGTNFPDAMTGGAHIGKKGGPLLLTDPFTLSGPTDAYLKANAASIATIFVYGGLAAVSNPVAAQAQADIV